MPAKLELRNRKSPEVIIQKLVVIDWLGDIQHTHTHTHTLTNSLIDTHIQTLIEHTPEVVCAPGK